MTNSYSADFIERLLQDASPVIVELKDNSVYIGIFTVGYGNGHYQLKPLTINDGGMGFPRSYIKRIIYFNGLIVPKNQNGKHKILNIIELNDLVNKAGYEFI